MGQRFPKPPAQAGPAMIADQAAKIKRLEGSRDTMGSQLAKVVPDTAAALAAANSAQTGVNAINTRLGTADFTFLSQLSEMPDIGDETGGASRSGIGTISGTPTAAEFNALNTAYNNATDTINSLVSKL